MMANPRLLIAGLESRTEKRSVSDLAFIVRKIWERYPAAKTCVISHRIEGPFAIKRAENINVPEALIRANVHLSTQKDSLPEGRSGVPAAT